MNIRFDGRVIAVTGAGHGLGRAIARGFAAAGGQVFACDRMMDGLEETRGGQAMELDAFDLTAPGAAREWIGSIERRTGQVVDVLISNAGGVCGQVMQPVDEVAMADWNAVVDINLNASFNLCAAVAGGMKRAGRGSIVTISSRAGLKHSLTGIQAYCASKHALVGLTRQLAHELGPYGVRVNSVAPGFIPSNPASIAQFESYGPQGQQDLLRNIALRRVGEADDIANAALFLASDYAKWISGVILNVDGGT